MKNKRKVFVFGLLLFCLMLAGVYPPRQTRQVAHAEEGTDVIINDANFPDVNFREHVKQYDLDKNGYLSASERDAVVNISCESKSIKDLTGIEHFLVLTSLYCFDNQLTSLDVSKNTALEWLFCAKNHLTTLNLCKNIALTELSCRDNLLTSLDVSKNTALTELSCSDNMLTSLDVNANAVLRSFWCSGNQLSSLEISAAKFLVGLSCENNCLTTLNLSKNPSLEWLFCYDNPLTLLDVSSVPAIKDAVINGVKDSSEHDYDIYFSKHGELCIDKTVTITTNAPVLPCTIIFDANGHGTAPMEQIIEDGKTATKPVDPVASGWTFGGWYEESACTNAFDISTPITENKTLYARWTEGNVSPLEITYTIVSGRDGNWTKDIDKDHVLTVKRNVDDDTCFSHFTTVQIDGTTLTAGTDYEAKSGSAAITLKASTLQKLPSGTHTVTVNFDDGKAVTNLTVREAFAGGKDQSPKTGDNCNLGLWITLMAVSLTGLSGVTVHDKKEVPKDNRAV